jgi:hypothetical protein
MHLANRLIPAILVNPANPADPADPAQLVHLAQSLALDVTPKKLILSFLAIHRPFLAAIVRMEVAIILVVMDLAMIVILFQNGVSDKCLLIKLLTNAS